MFEHESFNYKILRIRYITCYYVDLIKSCLYRNVSVRICLQHFTV